MLVSLLPAAQTLISGIFERILTTKKRDRVSIFEGNSWYGSLDIHGP
jgi:hypothetical protein